MGLVCFLTSRWWYFSVALYLQFCYFELITSAHSLFSVNPSLCYTPSILLKVFLVLSRKIHRRYVEFLLGCSILTCCVSVQLTVSQWVWIRWFLFLLFTRYRCLPFNHCICFMMFFKKDYFIKRKSLVKRLLKSVYLTAKVILDLPTNDISRFFQVLNLVR